MKGRWRKSEGEMSVRSGPPPARGDVSATEHLQHPVVGMYMSYVCIPMYLVSTYDIGRIE